jgi:dihydroflavonol-4-reductase
MALAAQVAERRPPLLHPPPAIMRGLAGVARVVERMDIQLPYSAETLRLMAGTTWIGSSAKAERELGFTSRPLEEGLRHTLEHEMRQLGMA